MSRIAVIGAGISGLASAWLLSRRHDVLLIERDDRLGGHTHTHLIDTPGGTLALDTGFLVHNVGFDERFIRMWDLYLAFSQAGFAERHISDVQLLLTKAYHDGTYFGEDGLRGITPSASFHAVLIQRVVNG